MVPRSTGSPLRADHGLEQVQPVPVGIDEDGNGPIGFGPRFLLKLHTLPRHVVVVTWEVVRVQNEKDTAAGLVSDTALLFRCCCLRKKQAGPGSMPVLLIPMHSPYGEKNIPDRVAFGLVMVSTRTRTEPVHRYFR